MGLLLNRLDFYMLLQKNVSSNLLKLYSIAVDNNDCCKDINNVILLIQDDILLRVHYTKPQLSSTSLSSSSSSKTTSLLQNEQYLNIQSKETILVNIFKTPIEFSKSNIVAVKLYLNLINNYIEAVLIYEAYSNNFYNSLADVLNKVFINIK